MKHGQKILKRRIFKIFSYMGIRIAKTRDEQSLVNFLRELHPLKFDLIRLGGNGDGGYLIPDDLENITICFSPGVSNIMDFELDLAERGISSFMADFTVSPKSVSNPNFHFIQKFVGPMDSDQEINFQSWILSNSKEDQDLILQMDIEGAEYATIMSCDQSVLRRFRIMVIEFHGLDLLLDEQAHSQIEICFKKILQDFQVVHIHPNNNDPSRFLRTTEVPSLMEFTFIRKDRVKDIEHQTKFPHPLDRPTVSNVADIKLPTSWFRGEK
jgi:hypothetical protein